MFCGHYRTFADILSEPGFLGFKGLTGLGSLVRGVLSESGFSGLGPLLRVCIYDRRGWADLKGACVSGVDSWPGLCGRPARVPCRVAALGVGEMRRTLQSGRAWCGWDCGASWKVSPWVWAGWRRSGRSCPCLVGAGCPVWWGRDGGGPSWFLWGVYEYGNGLFS